MGVAFHTGSDCPPPPLPAPLWKPACVTHIRMFYTILVDTMFLHIVSLQALLIMHVHEHGHTFTQLEASLMLLDMWCVHITCMHTCRHTGWNTSVKPILFALCTHTYTHAGTRTYRHTSWSTSVLHCAYTCTHACIQMQTYRLNHLSKACSFALCMHTHTHMHACTHRLKRLCTAWSLTYAWPLLQCTRRCRTCQEYYKPRCLALEEASVTDQLLFTEPHT